ncbi:hypothetical protein MP228_010075 [Amoeboaphelidium protococcarum]|nr:hypothetical protein MP228_010075 [Amoeboaphelidium protococcarum]
MSSAELATDEGHHGAFGGRVRLQKQPANTQGGANWVDEERANIRAYEYLCHVGEAKEWIEACIGEDIGAITDLDNKLRNGIVLAKLAKFFEPTAVKRIFEDPKLQFRHSDNTNYFFEACKKAKFPNLFMFELTDVYDKKNIPKVIYCIHALSHFLAKRGIAPKIKNLVGQLNFTNEELEATEKNLNDAGVAMPSFGNVEGALAKEMNEVVETEEEKREKFLKEHEAEVTKLQAQARGYLQRKAYQQKKQQIAANADNYVKIQAQIRGFLARRAMLTTLNHYKEMANLKKVVKLQAYHKGKQTSRAYQSFQDLEHIPANAIHTFVHLMDDQDKDFQEEVELENLKQEVIKKIRDNNQTETNLNDLDIKIALLVRNRITLDEFMKMDKAAQKKAVMEKEAAAKEKSSIVGEEMFTSANFKSLDKDARRRLELYQNLFYILQTQPKYLAKMIFLVKQTKIRSFMDHVLLTLYNYANSSREEFLLLKFFQQAIHEEMNTVTEVADFLRGNPVFIKIVVHYYRGAKERQFLRDLLQPLVKDVLGDDKLDLETDPLVLYRTSIKEEESRTGEQSKRPYDVSKEDALKDPEVGKVFEEHLKQLQVYTDKFLDAIIKNLDRMPYGIRFIAKKLHTELIAKFPPSNSEEEERILRVIGNLVYYRYMNPAIVAPEGFDVIEQLVSPLQRKNLAEISKCLQQVSNNRPYDNENAFMNSLNPYIKTASVKFGDYFKEAINVAEAEEHFQMSDFSDLTKTSKPVIYITPQEIFNTHALVETTMDEFSVESNDPLKQLIKELGPPNESSVTVDYSGTFRKTDEDGNPVGDGDKAAPAGSMDDLRGNEISLTLSSRYMEEASAAMLGVSGGEQAAQYKNLFLETKRFVLSLIRVQNGKNLSELLQKPVTSRDQKIYQELVKIEKEHLAKNQAENMGSTQHLSGNKVDVVIPETLPQLKAAISSNLEKLVAIYDKVSKIVPDVKKQKEIGITRVSPENNYQEILTSIGLDLRNKHRRRQQRRTEIRSLNRTIQNLDDKMEYLNEQKQSYQDYINSCMAALTGNRKKQTGGNQGKFLMPFSPQWYHVQELKKSGKVPQFGSYKYGADVLYKKGVLVAVDGYSPKQYDKITLTISSDESGVFNISVSILGITMPNKMELKLEDLLQYQFDNVQIIPLFDGAAKVNVNLLLFLINKKFYV